MQKLTSILAVLDQPATAIRVLRKAIEIASHFDARLELLAIEPVTSGKLTSQCLALGYPNVAIHSASRLGRRLDAVVLEQVERCNPDLVIKARAGAHPVRRVTLTANDWNLAQSCPVPLLLAGLRSWAKPVRFAATVDVSDEATIAVARAVMQAAGFLALGSHGYLDVLYTESELHDSRLRMERTVKLSQLVREFHVGCERLQMFDGVPEKRLPPLIASRRYDLLLLGAVTHRDGLLDTMFPLTSKLVDATPGDVLLVKSPAQRIADAEPITARAESSPVPAARLN